MCRGKNTGFNVAVPEFKSSSDSRVILADYTTFHGLKFLHVQNERVRLGDLHYSFQF